jgi:hypothetical protein
VENAKEFWTTIVPSEMDRAIEEAVRQGLYRTKSELVRNAVRKELEILGFNFKLSNDESTPPAFCGAGKKDMKVEIDERSLNC